jgi:hypothetical protein
MVCGVMQPNHCDKIPGNMAGGTNMAGGNVPFGGSGGDEN